jgi:hypothetical protein
VVIFWYVAEEHRKKAQEFPVALQLEAGSNVLYKKFYVYVI